MPIDVKNIDKPTRFYWPEDPEGKEWIELHIVIRNQTVDLLKKANIKQTAEYKVNPTTKQYERITFIDTNFDKDMLFGDLMLEAVIVDWNFATPEGEIIPCTKENKLLMTTNQRFRNWIDECLDIMREGKKKAGEEEEKKLIEVIGRFAEKPSCDDVCKPIYFKKGEDPPCLTCTPPIYPENQDAFQIYQLCQNQVIALSGMGGVGIIDINHLAVWKAIDEYGIEDRLGCFEKVIRAFSAMKEKQNKKSIKKK